jgi:short-subunit dehydrogenase
MAKTALITGASVGIGLELARCFARGRYDCILVARNEDKLNEAASELRGMNVQADVLAIDLAKPDAAARIVESLGSREIDALVNNAGFGAIGRFHELDLARQLEMIQVNISALVDLTHRLLPRMVARKSGGILYLASTASFQPGPWMAIYYASKAFVLSFSEALAEEVKGDGIRVTALCPGPTYSEFRQRAKMEKSGVFRNKSIPVMLASQVAEAGYRGLMRGKRVVVPGLVNKFGVAATRLAPRGMVTRMAGKINRAK